MRRKGAGGAWIDAKEGRGEMEGGNERRDEDMTEKRDGRWDEDDGNERKESVQDRRVKVTADEMIEG